MKYINPTLKYLVVCFLILISGQTIGQKDTLRIMTYNLLQFPGSTQSRADDYLKPILKYAQPDIFLVNEITSSSGANYILTNALNTDGVTAYDKGTYNGSSSLNNMMYYNTDKLTFVGQDVISTSPRETDGFHFYYNDPNLSYHNDTVFIHVYVAHLKAGSTGSDESQRTTAAATIRAYLDAKSNTDNHFIVGDFNLYSSSETAYQNLIASGNCQFNDPLNLPGTWHASSGYALIHTQSTRTASFGGGATGGLDDRFDFILCTGDVINDQHRVHYLPGTYKTLGNDGNHYNKAIIDSPTNTVYPDSVIQDLYPMSDHMPVMADLEISLPNGPSTSPCSDLYFSEYVEGSSQNRALEVYNPTDISIDLSDYELHFYPNGSATLPAYRKVALSGTVLPESPFVITAPNAGTSVSSVSDLTVSQLDSLLTGNDAVTLFNTLTGQDIDLIGIIGNDPGSGGWTVGTGSTTDHTLVRADYINQGSTQWNQSVLHWVVLAQDEFDSLANHSAISCLPPSGGDCAGLFFSEYVRGTAVNKALEIYNASSGPVVLQGDYSIRVYNGGSTSYYETVLNSGVIMPDSVFVITNQYTTLTGVVNNADQVETTFPGVTYFTGDDAVVLFHGSDTLDIIGVVGQDPGTYWTVSGTNGISGNTASNTLVRDPNVHKGQTDWTIGSGEWIVLPQDEDDYIGEHTMYPCGMSLTIPKGLRISGIDVK